MSDQTRTNVADAIRAHALDVAWRRYYDETGGWCITTEGAFVEGAVWGNEQGGVDAAARIIRPLPTREQIAIALYDSGSDHETAHHDAGVVIALMGGDDE